MAEALLRRRLEVAGVDARVGSAGFLVEGEPATDDAIQTMLGYDLDISDHRSRVVTPGLATSADLIVTMTGQHIAELAGVDPGAWPRAFPLRNLVRRAQVVGRRRPDEPLDQWAARMGAGRTPRDVLSAPASDDVQDPIGMPRSAYEQTAADLDQLLESLVLAIRT